MLKLTGPFDLLVKLYLKIGKLSDWHDTQAEYRNNHWDWNWKAKLITGSDQSKQGYFLNLCDTLRVNHCHSYLCFVGHWWLTSEFCLPLSLIPVRILLSTTVTCSYILAATVTYPSTYSSLNHCHLLLYSGSHCHLSLYVFFSQPLSLTPIFCQPLSLIPVRILSTTVSCSYKSDYRCRLLLYSVSHCHLSLYVFFSQPLSVAPINLTTAVAYSYILSTAVAYSYIPLSAAVTYSYILLSATLTYSYILSTTVTYSYILSTTVTYSYILSTTVT